MDPTLERESTSGGPPPATRDVLVEEHLPLVRHVARQVMAVGSRDTEFDELVSAGTVGLIEAVQKFDATRGLAFSTFAAPRIRGAILDDCRRQDHVPRSIRSKQRKIRRAEAVLSQSLGRSPGEGEVAEALDIDMEQLWKWRSDVQGAAWQSLDDPMGEDDDAATLSDLLPGAEGEEVEASLTCSEEFALVREAMDELNEQQQTVLGLYYFEELNLRQIAGVLGLTESRISQVRSKALAVLRTRLAPLRVERA